MNAHARRRLIAAAAALLLGALVGLVVLYFGNDERSDNDVTVLVTNDGVLSDVRLTRDLVTQRRVERTSDLTDTVTLAELNAGLTTTRAMRPNEIVTHASVTHDQTPTLATPGESASARRPILWLAVGVSVIAATGAAALKRRRRHHDRVARKEPSGVADCGPGSLRTWSRYELAVLTQDLDPDKVTGAPLVVELSEESGIEILWDAPQHAPTVGAWRAADGGWAWRLDYDPESPLPPDELPAGIPALVTIGHREGRQLLIDLETFGTLAVTGPPDCTADLLRSVALELSCGNDLADAYVSLVDIDGDPLVAPRHRLTAQTLTEAIGTAEKAIDSAGAALRHDPRADIFRARVGDAAPINATVIVASGCQEPVASSFTPRRGAALVMASDRATIADGGARIEISDDGVSARLEPPGIDFTPLGLDASIVDALASASVAMVVLPEVGPDAVGLLTDRLYAPDDGADAATPSVVGLVIATSDRVN